MKYIIEFELPDNDTVKKEIKTAYVAWSVWGYSGFTRAKPMPPVQPLDVQTAYYKGLSDGIKKCTEKLKRLNDEMKGKQDEPV